MHLVSKIESVTMTHTKDSIRRLSKVQYKAFSGVDRVLWYILSILLIASGFGLIFNFTPPASYALLAFGCLIFANVGITARLNADQVLDQIRKSGGNFPSTTIVFYDTQMQVTEHAMKDQIRSLPYTCIRKLVEDGEYLYLFVSDKAAYMLPVKEFKDAAAIKHFLEETTSLQFVPPSQLLTYSLANLRRRKSK